MTAAAGDAAPLKTDAVANYFAIGQSNLVGGATNNIMTVTIILAAALKDGDAVVISDLKGAETADGDLTLDGADKAKFIKAGTTDNKGVWAKNAGTLTMEVAADLAAGTQYVFTFQLTNPATAPTAPAPKLEATLGTGSTGTAINNGGAGTGVTMTLPGTALNG